MFTEKYYGAQIGATGRLATNADENFSRAERGKAGRFVSPVSLFGDPGSIDDERLYALCKRYGEQARLWRQKFIGLLPEVNRRKLYEKFGRHKKSFGSIVEFASILAGVSREQVYNVLNLDRVFEDKPVLRKMLVNGEVSINKLIRITSVVTIENQEFWATQVRLLSKSAIETLVRDEKILNTGVAENGGLFGESCFNNEADLNGDEVRDGRSAIHGVGKGSGTETAVGTNVGWCSNTRDGEMAAIGKFENKSCNGDGLQKPRNGIHQLPGQLPPAQNLAHPLKLLKLQLGEEVVDKLLEMQNKGLNINEILLAALQKRDQEIAEEKEKIGEEILEKQRSEIVKNAKNNLTGGGDESGLVNLGKGACASGGGAGMVRGVETENGVTKPNLKNANTLPNKYGRKNNTKPSHYIAVKIKNILTKEQGIKCSMPTCSKPAQETDHIIPFALSQNHDPRNLRKLCREHHILAHSVDIQFSEIRRRF